MNSSLCYSELGFPSLALSFCERARSVASGRERDLLHLEFAEGFARLKLGQSPKARLKFANSLRLSRGLGDARMQADNFLYLAKTWLSEGMLDSAEQALINAQRLAHSHELNEIDLDICRTLIQVANKRDNPSQLATFQAEYIQLKEELYNIELEKALASFEGNWLEDENQRIISFQSKLLEEKQKALAYQKWITTVFMIIGILILSIIFLCWKDIYLKKKATAFLKDQVRNRKQWLTGSGTPGPSSTHSVKVLSLARTFYSACRNLDELLQEDIGVPVRSSLLRSVERIQADFSQACVDLAEYEEENQTKNGTP